MVNCFVQHVLLLLSGIFDQFTKHSPQQFSNHCHNTLMNWTTYLHSLYKQPTWFTKRFSSTFHGVCCCLDVVLCNSSQTLPASIASSCQVCCPVMIVVLVCLSHRHRPTTATYHRHTYYSGTPPWTIEICPTILRLTQGRTFSAMVSHTCQPVKCPVPWGHLSLLSCTTLLGWGLNVWGYQ